jgi:hypothetical protein
MMCGWNDGVLFGATTLGGSGRIRILRSQSRAVGYKLSPLYDKEGAPNNNGMAERNERGVDLIDP